MFVSINKPEDLRSHKNYRKDITEYLADIRDPAITQNVADHIEPAKVYDEMFTQEEIEWMYGFAFSRCSTARHNPNGTIFLSGNMEGIYKRYKKKIDDICPGADRSPIVGGNFFITPDQYGLHNDSMRRTDWEEGLAWLPIDDPRRSYANWRNVIIPIFVTRPDTVSHAVFFKQRHIDWSHVYNHGNKMTSATTYEIVDDHSKINFHTAEGVQTGEQNLKPYDKEHFEKYLYYTPYERLAGLEPELTCEWKPRCPITFDAYQLHATNKGFKDKQWVIKMGLLLCFLRKVK